MDNSESDDSDYAMSTISSSDAQEGGECGADTRPASCPRYILPAPPPIPRVEDVPCFFQQLDLDEGACVDPLKAGMGNDYNTDGGVIESERTKYHCRCKLAEDGCSWSIWVSLRQNLGYWEVRKFGGAYTCIAPTMSADHS
ncbi:hypothetical protein PIB30_064887 [Stylosanthes scabra]|uniref:Transposase MuDR plant domain-containing protein n=1 Tax=Stylosanthes scabra TaxID=79078 RepID=A0ABU6VKV9_9FABA|nr:hypothetical protein [Stylosanthes scabra]